MTDPTFDPPGRRYTFGLGSSSRKLTGPAIAAADLGPIDAVLLSHDHHGDNLDTAGRALLPAAGVVLTTVAGARRLGGMPGPSVLAGLEFRPGKNLVARMRDALQEADLGG